MRTVWLKLPRQFFLTVLSLVFLAPASLGWGWGGDSVALSLPSGLDELVAPLPPPALPVSPIEPMAEEWPFQAEPLAEPSLVLDDPLLEDPRAEALGLAARLDRPLAPPYPLVVNERVESLIEMFSSERGRERFALYLARSGRYLGMIQEILRTRGLPEELAYTALIESGFSPRAVSRAGAHGLWQFMEATARRYGLVVDRWVDERLDPVKSTVAAAQYLQDLFQQFGHWFLAQAAYNAGEARVARAIQRANTTDFWSLTRTRHLRTETKLFVPSILAATVIAQDPGRYGFEVEYHEPLAFDEVTVPKPMDFETIASLACVSVEKLRELNPALKSGVTPLPGPYRIRLPEGSGARFERALTSLPADGIAEWGLHRVRPGQGLRQIAKLYQIPPERLAEVNRLRNWRLRRGTELLVPLSRRVEEKRPPVELARALRKEAPGAVHVVRRGETLWGIASRYRMEVKTLARLNGLEPDEVLYPGDRLRVLAD